ncbi:Lipase, GDSL [Artemisia annua]|uniref:Lipase, GDSL n=1 Tax=Artemisia annua TaxID=35608 RepID=A0A2U1NXD5_ARTAN|nr:Lipase, GDSL [Artemisia annua]
MTVMVATGKTGATIFIFGDSTADVGTNTHLPTCTARANHRYHGIDYAYSKAIGRFSNGRNTADLIARLLGNYIVRPPPFLFLLSRNPTFKRNIQARISPGAGSPTAQGLKFRGAQSLYKAHNHIAWINKIKGSLHCARMFGIISTPQIGCCPAARPHNSSGGCLNDNARSFYKDMQSLLLDFSLLHQGFKYSLGNTYAMTMNVIENPRGNRFREVKASCCGDGTLFHGVTDCVVGAKLCSNRADFLLWDKFHPTEMASQIATLTLVYGEGIQYVTPMNLSSLVMA